jgi:hypothetical protein
MFMGYSGKYQEKLKAQKLRQEGFSYTEIQQTIKASKDTLSRWCRDIILSPEQITRLQNKRIEGGKKGGIIGAKKQQILKINKINKINNECKKEIGSLSKRDRFIAGIALYIGEGLKGDSEVCFTNSNPKIIAFIMGWFREFCQIPEYKYHGQIWIHDNLNEEKAKRYWSKISKIPISQFRKSYISKNKQSNKIRKQIHSYGIFAVKIPSVDIQRKIIGWSTGILN